MPQVRTNDYTVTFIPLLPLVAVAVFHSGLLLYASAVTLALLSNTI